ncbi:hypothetical protein ACFQDG_14685 [Natronoarchaeum mannanilyticum]|uniref:hypothetical protein n=1 Tax=Natronoarchaeum mannanilyticum TaxID=926360 RepID=UPI0031CF16E1
MTREKYTRRRAVLATGTTLAAVGLSGCAGVLGGGADGVVTENELEGDLEVLDHEIENTRLSGTKSVKVDVTVTNNSEDALTAAAIAEFFDGNGVSIDESAATTPKSVPRSQDVQLHPAARGRVEDVSRYELRLVERF